MILLKHYDSYIIVTGEKSMFLFLLLTEQYVSLYFFCGSIIFCLIQVMAVWELEDMEVLVLGLEDLEAMEEVSSLEMSYSWQDLEDFVNLIKLFFVRFHTLTCF